MQLVEIAGKYQSHDCNHLEVVVHSISLYMPAPSRFHLKKFEIENFILKLKPLPSGLPQFVSEVPL